MRDMMKYIYAVGIAISTLVTSVEPVAALDCPAALIQSPVTVEGRCRRFFTKGGQQIKRFKRTRWCTFSVDVSEETRNSVCYKNQSHDILINLFRGSSNQAQLFRSWSTSLYGQVGPRNRIHGSFPTFRIKVRRGIFTRIEAY